MKSKLLFLTLALIVSLTSCKKSENIPTELSKCKVSESISYNGDPSEENYENNTITIKYFYD